MTFSESLLTFKKFLLNLIYNKDAYLKYEPLLKIQP